MWLMAATSRLSRCSGGTCDRVVQFSLLTILSRASHISGRDPTSDAEDPSLATSTGQVARQERHTAVQKKGLWKERILAKREVVRIPCLSPSLTALIGLRVSYAYRLIISFPCSKQHAAASLQLAVRQEEKEVCRGAGYTHLRLQQVRTTTRALLRGKKKKPRELVIFKRMNLLGRKTQEQQASGRGPILGLLVSALTLRF
ncbi:hypothetical protein IE81DRAFT_146584 [Ceraceosorus guamensis]|uniref:Uncharacterized protein n=1 Tax=Ceraceosorus guamensis TaxID=1522189 RepID=A0A316VWS3_9BASI|nr:hypothetical protein IE81DRAFT_146584 [Ceraceosorus guamensis]PWN42066.1 hypothetical protein IE81DRAFT_146584 [Ceraceosorus guamensis]